MKEWYSHWRVVGLVLLNACHTPIVVPTQDAPEHELNGKDEVENLDVSLEDATADAEIMDAVPDDLGRSDLLASDHPDFYLDLVVGRDGSVRDVSDATRADRVADGGFFTAQIRQIETSCRTTCAVATSGEVYCWGDSHINRLPTVEEAFSPRLMPGLRNIQRLGISCDCAGAIDGDGAVWCWGDNWTGSGGLEIGSADPIVLTPGRRRDIVGVVDLAWLSNLVFLARSTDGTLYAHPFFPPVETFRFSLTSPIQAVTSGLFSYCVVLANGRVACFQRLSDDPAWVFSQGPRLVEGVDNVMMVAVGFSFFCALKRDGTVWCWGESDAAQTGTPPEMAERCLVARSGTPPVEAYRACVRRPRQVEGLRDVVEIRASHDSACALLRDGTVWCWGSNGVPVGLPAGSGGTIGDGLPVTELCPSVPWNPPEATPAPVPCRRRPSRVVGLTGVTTLAMYGEIRCAALAAGGVRCWGDNDWGQLGTGDSISRSVPVPVVAPR